MGNQFKQFHGCYVRVFIQFLFNFITFVGVRYLKKKERDTNARKGIGRRSTSLRQTRTPQISLELQVPSLHSPVIGSLTNATATTTTPKKSNWEVIEHFNNAEKGRGSVSSSLIAVSCCLHSEQKWNLM